MAPYSHFSIFIASTDLQEKDMARLRELAPAARREPGGGIHAA